MENYAMSMSIDVVRKVCESESPSCVSMQPVGDETKGVLTKIYFGNLCTVNMFIHSNVEEYIANLFCPSTVYLANSFNLVRCSVESSYTALAIINSHLDGGLKISYRFRNMLGD